MDQSPKQINSQTPRPYRPRKKSERDTAERILASAALLMPEQGYDSLKMRDLARHAGIGLGTVYGHFLSKEEIAVHLVARGVDAVHLGMRGILHSSQVPHERLHQLLVARVVLRQQQTRGQHHPVNEATPELGAALAFRRRVWRERERKIIAQVIDEGQFAGVMVYRSFQDIAQTLLWATDGLVAEALGTGALGTGALGTVTETVSPDLAETVSPDLAAATVGLDSEDDSEISIQSLYILDESHLGSGGLELKTQRVVDLLVSGLKKPEAHEHPS